MLSTLANILWFLSSLPESLAFRRALGELLGKLRTRGQTTVLVTHDLEFAEVCAARWVVLGQGKVVTSGAPETVMGHTDALRQTGLEATQAFRLRRILETLRPDGGAAA